MVRCRNSEKNLVIEIIPSPSFIDKLTANFHRLYIIRQRPFEIKSERSKPEFAGMPCWRERKPRVGVHHSRNITIIRKIRKGVPYVSSHKVRLSILSIIYFVDSFSTTSYGSSVLVSTFTPSIRSRSVLHATMPSSFESKSSEVMDGTLLSNTILL